MQPRKCSLLLLAPLPSNTQSLKVSLTGPSQLYWNPFHLALLCSCPAAAEVSSKSPLLSAMLQYLSCSGKKKLAATVDKRQVENQELLLLPLLLYYYSSFIIIDVSLLNAVHLRNTHGVHYLFGTGREGASQKIHGNFWDRKPQKDNKISTLLAISLCLLTRLGTTLLPKSRACFISTMEKSRLSGVRSDLLLRILFFLWKGKLETSYMKTS